MAQNEENSSRFWEFYALRYSVGAVLGALILFFLVRQNEPLSNLIFVKPGEPIDLIQVGIFLGVGLVYSYLASAPILVFHVGRFLIPRTSNPTSVAFGKSAAIYLGLNLIPALVFFLTNPMGPTPKSWFSLIIYLASVIFTGQLLIIFKCRTQRSRLFLFYKLLATKRAHSKGGIVDSYRHLREHGNAFGIVFFEMFLGLFMFATTMYISLSPTEKPPEIFEITTMLAVVILTWIIPASLVWLIGCIIEQEFVES